MDSAKTESTPLKGHVRIELLDENGAVKEVQEFDNTFTTAGDVHVADRLAASPAQNAMGWMSVGTGTAAFSKGSTTLNTELDRNALDGGYPVTGSGGDANDVIYKASWAAGDGTGAITEAGIFNAASNGTMLAASTFSVINKGASDTLTITWTVTCGG